VSSVKVCFRQTHHFSFSYFPCSKYDFLHIIYPTKATLNHVQIACCVPICLSIALILSLIMRYDLLQYVDLFHLSHWVHAFQFLTLQSASTSPESLGEAKYWHCATLYLRSRIREGPEALCISSIRRSIENLHLRTIILEIFFCVGVSSSCKSGRNPFFHIMMNFLIFFQFQRRS
jgi:hypothetical protein